MRVPCLLALLLTTNAYAHVDPDSLPLNYSSELRDYCQMRSEAQLVGAGKTPHNWVASYVEDVNTFRVDGKWQVDGKDVTVTCRAARGSERRFATIDIR